MKLSEKGYDKIYSSKGSYNDFETGEAVVDLLWLRDDIEFDQDDFEGAIVLTVEEAIEILDYLSYLHLRGGKDSFLRELEKCNQNLYERIEQAEKK